MRVMKRREKSLNNVDLSNILVSVNTKFTFLRNGKKVYICTKGESFARNLTSFSINPKKDIFVSIIELKLNIYFKVVPLVIFFAFIHESNVIYNKVKFIIKITKLRKK